MGERSRRTETEVPKKITTTVERNHKDEVIPSNNHCRHCTLPKNLRANAPESHINSSLCVPRDVIYLHTNWSCPSLMHANHVSTILLGAMHTRLHLFFTSNLRDGTIPFADGKTQKHSNSSDFF